MSFKHIQVYEILTNDWWFSLLEVHCVRGSYIPDTSNYMNDIVYTYHLKGKLVR